MTEIIYVTEPDVINVQLAGGLLPADYELYAGNTSFAGTIPQNCTTLLIRSATVVGESIIEKFPDLQSIIRVGVGLDNIDVTFCKRKGISIYNSPGANADAVSDYVVCMMLVALRKVATLTPDDVTSWNRFKFTGHSMSAQSIGIVGFGHIGKLVYQKLRGFGCANFYVYDPFVRADALPEDVQYASSIEAVLTNSTIVTLHLPLLPETQHIMNREKLELVPKGAILINAARGGIVDEIAVAEMTRSRGLVYVADTVEGEPGVNSVLLQAENVIITPHIASLTEESEENMVRVAIENFLAGQHQAAPRHKPVMLAQ